MYIGSWMFCTLHMACIIVCNMELIRFNSILNASSSKFSIIFQYIRVPTVRTDKLKKKHATLLIYHSNNRFTIAIRDGILFPALERLLKMYPALKTYFLPLDNGPYILKNFFENEMFELYLRFLHSTMPKRISHYCFKFFSNRNKYNFSKCFKAIKRKV